MTSIALNHSAFERVDHEELRAVLLAATKFQLIVNLKTTGALGLTIPPSRLLAADAV